jgi:hypothetical protein
VSNAFELLDAAIDDALAVRKPGEPATAVRSRIVEGMRRRGLQLVFSGSRQAAGDGGNRQPDELVMPFGRHRGESVRDLVRTNRDYAKWLVDQATIKSKSLHRALVAELERTGG